MKGVEVQQPAASANVSASMSDITRPNAVMANTQQALTKRRREDNIICANYRDMFGRMQRHQLTNETIVIDVSDNQSMSSGNSAFSEENLFLVIKKPQKYHNRAINRLEDYPTFLKDRYRALPEGR